jgi:hypothetical protein
MDAEFGLMPGLEPERDEFLLARMTEDKRIALPCAEHHDHRAEWRP